MRILIVDDETMARKKLRRLLAAEGESLVTEASNGEEAVRSILTFKPDLLLLDIQIPRMNGFDVLRAVPESQCPYVIFVTAYDDYMLNAFEAHALDYLVKPIHPQRFRRALEHARKQVSLTVRASQSRVSELLEKRDPRPYLRRIVVKEDEFIFLVDTRNLDWIESVGRNAKLHVGAQVHLIHVSLKDLEQQLDPAVFVRIHKTIIVNLNRIKHLSAWFHGNLRVTLNDGTQLTLSKHYKKMFEDALAVSD